MLISYLKGIFRTFNNSLREKVREELKKKIKEIARNLGGNAELNFTGNYPATVNSKEEAQEVRKIALDVADNIDEDYQTMSSEDFSYFLEKVPGAMILIGCQGEEYYPQHSENFNGGINPSLLGTQIFYDLVKKYLL